MNNLFDPDFYPTPDEVIQKMAAPYSDRIHTATILEPSAGNGAILEFLTKKGVEADERLRDHTYRVQMKADPRRVYAVEKNPELTMILQQKGYRVVGSDFLAFRPEHRFDLIIMNPPFSSGVKHLLHAWEILPGGDIACLVNAESVRNAFSAERKRLQAVIAEHGSVEYLGQPFADADNPTDVEVALVRLHKEAKDDPFRIDAAGFAREKAPDFGTLAQESDQVAVNGKLDAYIRCWELTKAAAVEFIKAFATLKFFAGNLLPNDERGENTMEHILKRLGEVRFSQESMSAVYNDFLDSTKASAWNTIFAQIGLGKYMTTGLQKKLDDFRNAQGAAQLSKENINALFVFIMTNISTIMDQSVVEVYDLFTSYYKGNTVHDEGWKTNKRFRCNRKVILPYAVEAGWKPQVYGYNKYYELSSRAHYGSGRLDDIDKALCWLTGRNYDSLIRNPYYGDSGPKPEPGPNHSLTSAVTCIQVGDQDWHESAFFRIKAFKKGTLHLEFKDEAVWAKFNIAVNAGKNQIGMAEN